MDKFELRKKHRLQRVASKVNEKILDRVTSLEIFKNSEDILLYYPMENEVDVRPLFESGKNIYLPYIREKEMVFTLYTGDLIDGVFGIKVATGKVLEDYSHCMMIVPGLSFDLNCYRLGHGGGYYDKFLSKHRDIFTVGLQSDENLEEFLPHEEHDIPLKCVLTETSIFVS